MLADLRHMDGGTLASNTRLGPATSLNVYQVTPSTTPHLSSTQPRRAVRYNERYRAMASTWNMRCMCCGVSQMMYLSARQERRVGGTMG